MRDADVIVVATSATTPVLMGEWLSRGMHINAVGATRPTWRELDDDALRRARIYVESREAAMKESGDVIAAGGALTEIGEVVAGAKPARQSAGEITLFKSVGVAVEDVVAADLVYRRAAGKGAVRRCYLATQMFFGSVKKWSASLPPSRPTPLCFIPPKGTRRSRINQQLTQTVPVWICSATRWARFRFWVQTLEARP